MRKTHKHPKTPKNTYKPLNYAASALSMFCRRREGIKKAPGFTAWDPLKTQKPKRTVCGVKDSLTRGTCQPSQGKAQREAYGPFSVPWVYREGARAKAGLKRAYASRIKKPA